MTTIANKKISQLDAASFVYANDLFVLEQTGTAKSLKGQVFLNWLVQQADGHGGISSITWEDSGTPGNGQTHTGTITLADGTTSTVTLHDGIKGNTGNPWYVWIKYAGREPISNADMSNTPDEWIGIYSGTASVAPANYAAYTWYKYKGNKGDPAQIVSRSVQYQESTSASTPTGTWQDTVPAVAQGNYLWTHITLTFDSGSVDWFDVSRQGIDGSGSVNSVNGVSPDNTNNVSLGATNIPYGDTTVEDALDELSSSASGTQQQITASGILLGEGSGVVSAATKGTHYGAKTFTVKLSSGGWRNNVQTITSNNFATSGFAYTVSPATASRAAYIDAGVYADDVTENSKMTFHCESVPATALTVVIMRVVSA